MDNFENCREAVIEFLKDRRVKVHENMGFIRVYRYKAIYPYEHNVCKIYHDPDGQNDNHGPYLTDLTDSDLLFEIAKTEWFDFSVYGY